MLRSERKAVIEEIFVVFKDGTLLLHETRRLKPDRDAVILSGMLTAIQDFVKESFKDETEWKLKEIEFGENRIFIERGDYVYIAVVYTGADASAIQISVEDTVKLIEKRFWDTLETWDGDTQKLRGMRELLKPILRAFQEEDYSDKEAELKNLEFKLKEEQYKLNSAVKDKEKEHEFKMKEINEMESTLRKRGDELRMKEGKLTELSERSTKATEEIKNQWMGLHQKKQKDIDDKVKDLQKRDEELNERVHELNKMEAAITDKEAALKEKASLIESIKRELETEMEKVRHRGNKVSDRERELRETETRLEKLDSKLGRDREMLESEFEKISQMKEELLKKIEIVEMRWNELQNTEEKIRSREADLKKKEFGGKTV
jgi:chromosome segregation ATPase